MILGPSTMGPIEKTSGWMLTGTTHQLIPLSPPIEFTITVPRILFIRELKYLNSLT